MIPHSSQQRKRHSALTRFRVRLGHVQVLVEGASHEEAIRRARSELCRELPRLWDVIHHAEDARFRVEAA